jgi:hypothetical protein
MSTINSTSDLYNLYTQNNAQVSNSQQQTKVHHHHHKSQSQDSVQLSQQGLQSSSSTAPSSPLDSLVSNGTITQAQESAIQNAFQTARQASQSGVYTRSNQTNPISSLVSSGTITQAQASDITSAFQAARQSNQSNSTQTNPMSSLVSNGRITQLKQMLFKVISKFQVFKVSLDRQVCIIITIIMDNRHKMLLRMTKLHRNQQTV